MKQKLYIPLLLTIQYAFDDFDSEQMEWDFLEDYQVHLDPSRSISVPNDNLGKKVTGERRKFASFVHRLTHY